MKIKGFPSDARSFREKKLIIIKALLRNIDKREIMELFDLPPRFEFKVFSLKVQ